MIPIFRDASRREILPPWRTCALARALSFNGHLHDKDPGACGDLCLWGGRCALAVELVPLVIYALRFHVIQLICERKRGKRALRCALHKVTKARRGGGAVAQGLRLRFFLLRHPFSKCNLALPHEPLLLLLMGRSDLHGALCINGSVLRPAGP